MNRMLIVLAILMVPLIGLAQNESPGTHAPSSLSAPYQPAVPAPSTFNSNGGWGGYSSGGGTAAGSAMNGMANMMNAAGQRNLSNSAAAVNMTQAQKNEIQNRMQWTNTYFQMRQVNQQQAAAARGPNPTMEQLARYAKAGAPRPLGASQMDQVSGQLQWPSALQQPCFEAQRKVIDQLFNARATYGGLAYADQMKARQTIKAMDNELKSQIDQIPQQDYVACKSFLRSVDYAASRADIQE
jgi:hypothetical protein